VIASPKLKDAKRLPRVPNYFIGNDPKKWCTGIPAYEKVSYQAVYPGIDLAYCGNPPRAPMCWCP
jgi:hypothetical protein